MFVESGMCRGIRSGYGVFRFPEMVLLFLCLFFCEAFFASEALGFSSEDRRGRTASGVTVASSFADEEGDKGDALFELVLLKDKAEEKAEKEEPPLPPLSEGDARKCEKTRVKADKTKPPAPHTDASLLNAMEHAGRDIEDDDLRESMKDSGLGTPATRAAIL